MVLEFRFGAMEQNMKGTGKKIKRVDKVRFIMLMVIFLKVYFIKKKEKNSINLG